MAGFCFPLPLVLCLVSIRLRQSCRNYCPQSENLMSDLRLNGTTERPRLAVFRSIQHVYAQVIDDIKQHTLTAASTLSKEIRETIEDTSGPTVDVARKVGEAIGKLCIEKGISKVAFDRGGFVYHGRIKALADAAREASLEF